MRGHAYILLCISPALNFAPSIWLLVRGCLGSFQEVKKMMYVKNLACDGHSEKCVIDVSRLYFIII